MRVKKQTSIILKLLTICLAGYMIFTLVGLWRDLDESQKKLAELKEQKINTAAQIEEYRALLSDGSQKSIVEKAARDRFGYAYPGEEIYKEIK